MGDGDLEQKVGFDPYEPGRASLVEGPRLPIPTAVKARMGILLLTGVAFGVLWLVFPDTSWMGMIEIVCLTCGVFSLVLADAVRILPSIPAHILLVMGMWGIGGRVTTQLLPEGWGGIVGLAVTAAVMFGLLRLTGYLAARPGNVEYYGAVCPKCGSSDRLMNRWRTRYKCKSCETEWPARTWLWALKRR